MRLATENSHRVVRARARSEATPDLVRSPSDLPRDAHWRGRAEINLAGSVAARSLELATNCTRRSPTESTNRLTLELSGHINREAIDWSA